MEGLIPLIYRAIRRKKSRRYYRCLSSGDAAAAFDVAGETNSYGHAMCTMTPPPPPLTEGRRAMFEMAQLDGNMRGFMTPPPPEKLSGFDQGFSSVGFGYRRSASVQEFRHGSPSARKLGGGPAATFLRARSHRMLACVSGD